MSAEGETPPTGKIEEAGPEPLFMDDRSRDGPHWLRIPLAAVSAVAGVWIAVLLVRLPERDPILPAQVVDRLAQSGVSNPVTAVLLNFRAYDTLLEIAVLVVTLVAVWSLDRDTRPMSRDVSGRSDDPVLRQLARLVVPLSGVFAVYLTWVGAHGTGGGFQAGALLAGAGVLLAAGGYIPPLSAASRLVRGAVALAIFAFMVAGLWAMAYTGSFLRYPDGWAHGLILGLEAVIAIAVTVALVEFFVDVPAAPASDPSLERIHATGDPLGRALSRTGVLDDEE